MARKKREYALSEDKAISELDDWLYGRKIVVSDDDDEFKNEYKSLIGALMFGNVSISEDGCMVQKIDPILDEDGKPVVEELIYQSRMPKGYLDRIKKISKGKKTSTEQVMNYYASELTGHPIAYMKKLSGPDFEVMKSIVLTFL